MILVANIFRIIGSIIENPIIFTKTEEHPPTLLAIPRAIPPSDPCTFQPSVSVSFWPSPDEPGKLDDPKASYFVNPPLV